MLFHLASTIELYVLYFVLEHCHFSTPVQCFITLYVDSYMWYLNLPLAFN